MTKNDLPLVTVSVITYNSADYIIEGLESIKAQTYPHIELIVSDDCSTDNTVEIVRQWMEGNGSRFVRTELVTVEKNTGTAGNCNRSIAPARGEWIKILSGDDKFFPHTIERFMAFVTAHPEADICCSKLCPLCDDEERIKRTRIAYQKFYDRVNLPLKQQQREIFKLMFVPGPGWFFRKSLWESVGRFNEKYPFNEEGTFNHEVLATGHRIWLIDEELYGYTVRDGSLSHQSTTQLTIHQRDCIRYFKEVTFGRMLRLGLIVPALDRYMKYRALELKCAGHPVKSSLYKYSRFCMIVPIFNYLRYKWTRRQAVMEEEVM
jgi:alpha-1,3-rhamnosyltransferase